MLVIDKPTRLSDLISSDLVLRWAFPALVLTMAGAMILSAIA